MSILTKNGILEEIDPPSFLKSLGKFALRNVLGDAIIFTPMRWFLVPRSEIRPVL